HRPGIITRYSPTLTDWNAVYSPSGTDQEKFLAVQAMSKILRPRAVDHPAAAASFPDLLPDPNTGKINLDVDNDGDGVTDSIWVDLGYPVQRDATGKTFKPLFAF